MSGTIILVVIALAIAAIAVSFISRGSRSSAASSIGEDASGTVVMHAPIAVRLRTFYLRGTYGYVFVTDAGTTKSIQSGDATVFSVDKHPSVEGGYLISWEGGNLSANPEGKINFNSKSMDETTAWTLGSGWIRSHYNKFLSQKANGSVLADNPEYKEEEMFSVIFL